VPVDDFDGFHDAVVEEEPVGFAFEGGLGDEPDESEVFDVDFDTGFFPDLALGALGGGLAECHLELASDWGAESFVWRFDAMEEEDAAVFVAEVAEAGDFIGEYGLVCGLGHGQG
jgi:hypothetical protein